jgi:pimeloyl-ACP methyl ester carboxylesterase
MPLIDPTAHGGSANDAFHLVLPSLPGYGFSEKPAHSGWGIERIARAWAELMARIGYSRYVAQVGDWGAAVTVQLGAQRPSGLIGIHLNMLSLLPNDLAEPLGKDEQAALATYQYYDQVESGYAREQASRKRSSRATRCSTTSCSTGCRTRARRPHVFTGKVWRSSSRRGSSYPLVRACFPRKSLPRRAVGPIEFFPTSCIGTNCPEVAILPPSNSRPCS